MTAIYASGTCGAWTKMECKTSPIMEEWKEKHIKSKKFPVMRINLPNTMDKLRIIIVRWKK